MLLASLAISGCSLEGEAPGTEHENSAPRQPDKKSHLCDSLAWTGETIEKVDTRAARLVLQEYLALLHAGQEDDTASFWLHRNDALAFAARVEPFGDFKASIAEPSGLRLTDCGFEVSMSVQFLQQTGGSLRNLSDGTAIMRYDIAGNVDVGTWMIVRFNLQHPPVPLG